MTRLVEADKLTERHGKQSGVRGEGVDTDPVLQTSDNDREAKRVQSGFDECQGIREGGQLLAMFPCNSRKFVNNLRPRAQNSSSLCDGKGLLGEQNIGDCSQGTIRKQEASHPWDGWAIGSTEFLQTNRKARRTRETAKDFADAIASGRSSLLLDLSR